MAAPMRNRRLPVAQNRQGSEIVRANNNMTASHATRMRGVLTELLWPTWIAVMM
jgi:hypothetical protein